MAANYVLLERIELAASAASVTFSNIPQTGYTDLKVVVSSRYDADVNTYNLYINGANTSQTVRRVQGTGSSVGSSTYNEVLTNTSNSTANTFSSGELYFPNYNSTTQYKSISIDAVSENNGTLAYATMEAWLWSSNSAITSIGFVGRSANFVANSTFSLYGLAAVGTTPAIAPKASGGNITTDGTYWYHTFLASGTFTPQVGLTCDALVVAGGGGCGGGAGGGAGGYLTFTGQSLSTSQTITVGSGGTINTSTGVATNGNDSQVGSLTLVKGGGGGNTSSSPYNGLTGGSGGGAYLNGTGGSATSGQGNAGGSGGGVASAAAGGGGAGAVGGGPSTSLGGNGGNGLFTAISGGATTGAGQLSGGNYYFAGGGGGGSNGTPGTGGLGGGASAVNSSGNSGTINTGGGAGGYWTGIGSSNGGSGIVIIRYPIA